MPADWERRLTRWSVAKLIDEAASERIRQFELARAASSRTRWSVWLALLFGVLMLVAGILLLVSASWDQVSPLTRLAFVVGMVAVFHVGGALASAWSERLATVLHVAGTVALGPAIFIGGAILTLDSHWPSAVLLWAIGAMAAWLVRRDPFHFALVAVLAPAWLLSEWAAVGETMDLRFSIVGQAGAFLMALAYLTTSLAGRRETTRRALWWIGIVAFLPAAITLGVQAGLRISPPQFLRELPAMPAVPFAVNALAWAAAIVLPLVVALTTRHRGAWLNAMAAVWVVVLAVLPAGGSRMLLYAYLALGSVGLGAWGIYEVSPDRINLATACFAVTVLFFYFDNLMDKMGRSASLIGLGVLFLAGGYALDRVRKRMLTRAGGGVS